MSYTSIEQSRKLIELGLDAKTADMHYQYSQEEWEGYYAKLGRGGFKRDFPCWSLDALLKVMPAPINMNGSFAYPILDVFSKVVTYDVGMATYHKEEGADLVEAAYNTVVWLLTNGYIKKD